MVDQELYDSVLVDKRVTIKMSDEELINLFNNKVGDRFKVVNIEFIRQKNSKYRGRYLNYMCKLCGANIKCHVSCIIKDGYKFNCRCYNKGNSRTKSSDIRFDDFVAKAKEVYGDRFEFLRFIRRDGKRYVEYKCNVCGETSDKFLGWSILKQKYFCNTCHHRHLSESRTVPEDVELERFKKIHGDRYEYLSIFTNQHKYKFVRYRCKSCNRECITRTGDHLRGWGCYQCYPDDNNNPIIRCNDISKLSFDDLVKLTIGIYGDRFDYVYDYYVNGVRFINYKCNICGHINDSDVNDHLSRKHQCIECDNLKKSIIPVYSDEDEFERLNSVYKDYYEFISIFYKKIKTRIYKLVEYRCRECGLVKYSYVNNMLKSGKYRCDHNLKNDAIINSMEDVMPANQEIRSENDTIKLNVMPNVINLNDLSEGTDIFKLTKYGDSYTIKFDDDFIKSIDDNEKELIMTRVYNLISSITSVIK